MMKPVTYSKIKANKPLWLITGAVAVLMMLIGFFAYDKITESTYRNSRLYQTALKTENAAQFNHAIDTRQGNVLAEGQFTLLGSYKFPEMNKEFPYVKREKQEYTRHERTVCETEYRTETRTRTEYDSDGNAYIETYEEEVPYEECHQEEYYSWDEIDTQTLEGPNLKFMDREYPRSLFNSTYIRSIDASEIINGVTESEWYEKREKSWLGQDKAGNIRYVYDVAYPTFNGSILVNTSEGQLRPLNSSIISVEKDSVSKRVADAKSSAESAKKWFIGSWIFFMLIVLVPLTIYLYNPDILDT